MKLELEAQIRKQEALLHNPNLKLPDGGANVRRRLQHLNQQLEALGGASCSASCSGGDSVQDDSSSTAKSGPPSKNACPIRDGSSSSRSLSIEEERVSCPTDMPKATETKARATSVTASDHISRIVVPVARDTEDCSHASSGVTRGPKEGAVHIARDEARAASKNVGTCPPDPLRPGEDGITEHARHSGNERQSAEQRVTVREAPAAGVRQGTTSDEDRQQDSKFLNPGPGLLSPRLAAAIGTPLPEHRAGGEGQATQISQLQHRIKLLKMKLEMDATVLQDPTKRELLPDRGAKVGLKLKACHQTLWLLSRRKHEIGCCCCQSWPGLVGGASPSFHRRHSFNCTCVVRCLPHCRDMTSYLVDVGPGGSTF